MRLRSCFFLSLSFLVFSCKDQPVKAIARPLQSVVLVNQIKPEPTFEDLEGNTIELSDFKGKKILLNYWATWCRPCIEEMPSLLRAQEILKKENYVFLLASDQSLEKIEAFVTKKKFDFRFVKFNGSLAEMGVNALPTTFIYNEAGERVLKIVGQTEWDSDEVIDRFKKLQ